MSGNSHSQDQDDADFLDEDFVVEDIVSKNEDLEELFDEPAAGAAAEADTPGDVDSAPDEGDVLFTDHTQGLQESEVFERTTFDEQAGSEWSGELLDLESVGVPEASLEDEEAAAYPELVNAKASFAAELDSMLGSGEDFEMNADDDLELLDGPSADDGISEFEQSGPFVLDDGEGLWSEDDAESADSSETETETADEADEWQPVGAAAAAHAAEDEDDEAPIAEDDEQELASMSLRAGTAFADGDEEQAGWEPLPGTSMDQLSEVDEVQRAEEQDEEAEYESEPQYGAVGLAAVDLDDVDGHDIYAEDETPEQAAVLGGPRNRRGRAASLFLSVAASLLIVVGGAVVVMRPEWFGVRFEPSRVERVEIPRPSVEVVVVEPPSPVDAELPATDPGQTDPGQTGSDPAGTGGTEAGQPATGGGGTEQPPATGNQGGTEPVDTAPDNAATGASGNGQPVIEPLPVPQPEVTPPVVVVATGPEQPDATGGQGAVVVDPTQQPPGTGVVPVEPVTLPVIAATPVAGGNAWPVQSTGDDPDLDEAGNQLARFGDDLMVGDLAQSVNRAATAVDGVLPGSRAFAQLHNGNYFIGSVKHVAADAITLRVETGEVTLATEEIAQLTQLGSADYEELQKATRGFVRLTNNNRLIGGILSRIADDHVVLEFRSNRVMLPKSAVGEIVSGEGQDAVRLDTTLEEDSWLQKLVERELGTGRGVPIEPKSRPTAPGPGHPPR